MIRIRIGHFQYFGSKGKALMTREFTEFAEWMTQTSVYCVAGRWFLPNPNGRNIIKSFTSYNKIRNYYLKHKER